MHTQNHPKDINVPSLSTELAEFMGILFGDGNSYKRVIGKKIRAYQVRIAGHATHDLEYLSSFVLPLAQRLFGVSGSFYFQKDRRGVQLRFDRKKLQEALDQFGFPPGNKLKNSLHIPAWIKENESYMVPFLRGLIDTDGSLHRMSNQDPNLLRINFTNYDVHLLGEIRALFVSLRFHPSKIILNKQFFLSRKADLQRYIKQVGFNNPKHINRLLLFQKEIAPSSSGQFLAKEADRTSGSGSDNGGSNPPGARFLLMRALFVCGGNVGRSQIAEVFFNHFSKKHRAISAGVRVGRHEGETIAKYEQVTRCMADENFSLAEKRSKQITEQMVESTDLIISFVPINELPPYARTPSKVRIWQVPDAGWQSYDFHCMMRENIKERVRVLLHELGENL